MFTSVRLRNLVIVAALLAAVPSAFAEGPVTVKPEEAGFMEPASLVSTRISRTRSPTIRFPAPS